MFVDERSEQVLDDLLADDAVFFSPAIFAPQEGKATVAMYLRAASELFFDNGFHYVGEHVGAKSAVLEFAATVDGRHVNGVDILEWNDEGRITSFKVMIRPFSSLQLVMGRMAELLSSS